MAAANLRTYVAAAVLVLVVLVIAALVLAARASARGPRRAVAVVQSVTAPPSGIRGVVYFYEPTAGGGTYVTGHLSGLSPGVHGFHVHEKGDIGDHCNAAGAHYNPFGHRHAGPTAPARHMGDLGNITADSRGEAEYRHYDPELTLRGPHSVVGRTVVAHRDVDDLGLGTGARAAESLKTGNAGPRIGCGVIRPVS
jgi:Cu-Zn family superoxide dismutase